MAEEDDWQRKMTDSLSVLFVLHWGKGNARDEVSLHLPQTACGKRGEIENDEIFGRKRPNQALPACTEVLHGDCFYLQPGTKI